MNYSNKKNKLNLVYPTVMIKLTKPLRFKYFFLNCITLLVIISCAQGNLKETDSQSILPELTDNNLEKAKELENAAETEHKPRRKNLLLIQASYLYLQEKEFNQARTALTAVNKNKIKSPEKNIYHILKSKLFLQERKPDLAATELDKNLRLERLNLESQVLYSQTKAEIYFFETNYIDSVKQRIFISPLLDEDENKTNNELVWQALTLSPLDSISESLKSESDPELRAWLELSHIEKNYQHDLELQNEMLQNWQENNPNHQANKSLPDTLKQIKFALKNRPKHIAILLPDSGPLARSANAIKQGFLSNYYRSLETGSFTPKLSFINSSDEALLAAFTQEQDRPIASSTESLTNTKDETTQLQTEPEPALEPDHDQKLRIGFNIVYQSARDTGADLIIGPLNKKHIEHLHKITDISTPTLTLNYSKEKTDDSGQAQENLYEFGLSPEDDIQFLSEQARFRGFRHAAILAPRTSWGERLANSFAKEWDSQGGRIGTISYYENTQGLTKVIEQMLQIDLSEKRFKRLYYYSEGETLFYSRRRQDIDFIFLVSQPDIGRQIIPTFSFHNAGDLPVFTTSLIYEGVPNKKDKDLNTVVFSDLPSIINGGKHNQMAWQKLEPRYRRLVSMGVDTYNLAVHLPILKSSENTQMAGETGLLTMNPDHRIQRQPALAKFHGASIKPEASISKPKQR